MAIYNVFVKHLDGKTLTLKLPTQTISGETLKTHLFNITQIPPHNQRLITGTQQIDSQTLVTIPNGSFITIHLLLRLLGGKGGFGSLLRGAATKAGQKKTNNFDACRDMSGRRLRHVNAEKKLEEWKADAEERRLEKVADEFLKKNVKERKRKGDGESEKYVKRYREVSDKCMDVVDVAVRESFAKYEEGKRRVLGRGAKDSKRLKLWKDEESEDEEEDEEEDEKSVVLDMKLALRSEDGEGSSGVVLEGRVSEGESSGGGGYMESIVEEESGCVNRETFEVGEGSETEEIQVEESGLVVPEVVIREEKVSEKEVDNAVENVSPDVESGVSRESFGSCSTSSSSEVVEGSASKVNVGEVADAVAVTDVESGKYSGLEKPLDFGDYNSAKEMEILGMEGLKTELQARGLKCGGTLQERAARLFLLKTTPLDKIPKKLLAKK